MKKQPRTTSHKKEKRACQPASSLKQKTGNNNNKSATHLQHFKNLIAMVINSKLGICKHNNKNRTKKESRWFSVPAEYFKLRSINLLTGLQSI